MFDLTLRDALEQALSLQFNRNVSIYDFKSIAGGCINYTAKIDTSRGEFFIKANDADLYPDMFEKEVKGLELLSSSGNISIPQVVNYGKAGNATYLILDYIPSARQNGDFWENFGASLANIHRNTQPSFGLDHDNYIGSLKQSNKQYDNWIDFFVEERLKKQVKIAMNNSYITKSHVKKLENLFKELNNIFPNEPPALLHGDLWSGNFMTGRNGEACIFDPAVYYGHREAELAFTQLFGGFDDRFYKGYNSTYPLESGFEDRKDIYNLYPLLVHVNLFGGRYLNSVESILNKHAYMSS